MACGDLSRRSVRATVYGLPPQVLPPDVQLLLQPDALGRMRLLGYITPAQQVTKCSEHARAIPADAEAAAKVELVYTDTLALKKQPSTERPLVLAPFIYSSALVLHSPD